MADTFATVSAKFTRLTKELKSDRLAHEMGKMAKDEARDAASADLGGDPRFSGWAPELVTFYDVLSNRDGAAISFRPSKRSAGPWTVAQSGRNQAEGPRFTSDLGPRLTQTGRISRRRVKRWNGRTKGKGTADDAHKRIEARLPRVVDRNVGRAIRKVF